MHIFRTLCIALIAFGGAFVIAGPIAGHAQSNADLCADAQPGVVNCGPGNNRRPGGGGDKVPHHDGLNSKQPATRKWPSLSGILWQVVEDSRTPRTKAGGPLNDELLGHHGTDKLSGKGGHDIIWGDWDPLRNNTLQRDILDGGPGNDWLYPSHGRSIVKGGTGIDYVWAYYGKGTIDCGPGIDTARIRTNGAFKTKSCERIRHFCAHGENRKGQCLSPTGKPVSAARRR
jgi:Ca2+-binding RTX toxin-like protein